MTRRNLKRMVTIILTLCMLMAIMAVGVTSVSAVEISSDGEWEYHFYDYPNPYEPDRYQLSAYLGNKTSVTLPEKLDGHTMDTVFMGGGDIGTLKDIHVP